MMLSRIALSFDLFRSVLVCFRRGGRQYACTCQAWEPQADIKASPPAKPGSQAEEFRRLHSELKLDSGRDGPIADPLIARPTSRKQAEIKQQWDETIRKREKIAAI